MRNTWRSFGTRALSRAALAVALLGIPASSGTAAPRKAPELRVPITVVEDTGAGRNAGLVTVGVPLPRSARVTDVRSLHLVDETGASVTAQIRPLSRWD